MTLTYICADFDSLDFSRQLHINLIKSEASSLSYQSIFLCNIKESKSLLSNIFTPKKCVSGNELSFSRVISPAYEATLECDHVKFTEVLFNLLLILFSKRGSELKIKSVQKDIVIHTIMSTQLGGQKMRWYGMDRSTPSWLIANQIMLLSRKTEMFAINYV